MSDDQMTHDACVQEFIETGAVRLENAFSPEVAARCSDLLWAEMGLSPERPEEWTSPVVRIGHMSAAPFVAAANTPRLHEAYDRLVGKGRWVAPGGLGTFPVRFPSDVPPGDDGWHVDMSFGQDAPDFMDWRIDVESRGRALLMLFLMSDTGPDDAPTRLRLGSHRIVAKEIAPRREAGMTLRELSADGYASTAGCEEVAATGPAGTVWLCHPFTVHAAQRLRGMRPRLMAQPPLLPRGPQDPASPVQTAIRLALGSRG